MAKKKSPAAAALEKLDLLFDDDQDDASQTVSKKDLKQLAKQQKTKTIDITNIDATDVAAAAAAAASKKPAMSKKEEMLMKALELEKADEAAAAADASDSEDDDSPKLSKKELKALQKKQEKMAEKMEKKLAKKNGKNLSDSDDEDDGDEANTDDINIIANGADALSIPIEDDATPVVEEALVEQVTLEDKIRKERPPPRIRVMESSQPGYTSLRLENVGITFRNQEVLKDVTWGVQTGDRIGLVGANGAGKCPIR
jgi:ABC-type multidrug transport system fused ATPase/permease subunit